jgi:hypothetical protein
MIGPMARNAAGRHAIRVFIGLKGVSGLRDRRGELKNRITTALVHGSAAE